MNILRYLQDLIAFGSKCRTEGKFMKTQYLAFQEYEKNYEKSGFSIKLEKGWSSGGMVFFQ